MGPDLGQFPDLVAQRGGVLPRQPPATVAAVRRLEGDDAVALLGGDLRGAGIEYQGDDGRHFDFHAMRGQFISLLAARGVHPKVAQALARHSSITLTMDYYTHLDVLEVTGALDKLPELPGRKADVAEGERRRA